MDSGKGQLLDQGSENSGSSSPPRIPIEPEVVDISNTEHSSSDTPELSSDDSSDNEPQNVPLLLESISKIPFTRLAVSFSDTHMELNFARPRMSPGVRPEEPSADIPMVSPNVNLSLQLRIPIKSSNSEPEVDGVEPTENRRSDSSELPMNGSDIVTPREPAVDRPVVPSDAPEIASADNSDSLPKVSPSPQKSTSEHRPVAEPVLEPPTDRPSAPSDVTSVEPSVGTSSSPQRAPKDPHFLDDICNSSSNELEFSLNASSSILATSLTSLQLDDMLTELNFDLFESPSECTDAKSEHFSEGADAT